EILDGLSDEMTVVLNPRTAFAKEISDLQEEKAREMHDAKPEEVVEEVNADSGNATGDESGKSERPRGSEEGDRSGRNREAGNREEGNRGDGERSGPASSDSGEGRPRGGNPAALIERADKDGDGKLSREEAPGRMADNFDQIDANSDGFLEAQELTNAFSKMRAPE
ncbi:MAG: hypothetical protein KDA65_18825, partial [Planctomycetaceae bacterium]|nr:hypothetical protein [Planctomycetaceae bacterium]